MLLLLLLPFCLLPAQLDVRLGLGLPSGGACCLAGLLPGLGLARTPEPAGQPDSDSDSDSQVCWPVGLGLDS